MLSIALLWTILLTCPPLSLSDSQVFSEIANILRNRKKQWSHLEVVHGAGLEVSSNALLDQLHSVTPNLFESIRIRNVTEFTGPLPPRQLLLPKALTAPDSFEVNFLLILEGDHLQRDVVNYVFIRLLSDPIFIHVRGIFVYEPSSSPGVSMNYAEVLKRLHAYTGAFYLIRNGTELNRLDVWRPSCSESFRNCHLKLLLVKYAPLIYTDDGQGFMRALLNILYEKYNITYSIRLASKGLYGGLLGDNRTYDGAIGVLARRETELGISLFTYMHQRYFGTSFPHPFDVYGQSIFTPKPGLIPPDVSMYVTIYDSYVWALLGITLLLSTAYLWAERAFSMNHLQGGVLEASFVFLILCQSLLNQSSSRICGPKSRALLNTSLFYYFWLSFSTMISSIYLIMLTSLMLAPNYEAPVETLQDLLHRDYTLYLPKSHSQTLDIKAKYPEIFASIGQEVADIHIDEHLLNDQKKGASVSSIAFDRGMCRNGQHILYQSRPVFDRASSYSGWLVIRGAPWQEALNLFILRMTEAGFYQFNARKSDYVDASQVTLKNQERCARVLQQAEATLRKLKLEHLSIAFYVLLIGWALSGAVMLVEAAHHKMKTVHPASLPPL